MASVRNNRRASGHAATSRRPMRSSTVLLAAAAALATALAAPPVAWAKPHGPSAPAMRRTVQREVRRASSFCCSDCDAVAESMRATLGRSGRDRALGGELVGAGIARRASPGTARELPLQVLQVARGREDNAGSSRSRSRSSSSRSRESDEARW